MLPNGDYRFCYSRDMSAKHLEQELLEELESEGRIQLQTVALGYAIYRML